MKKVIIKLGGSAITYKRIKEFPTRLHKIETNAIKFIRMGVLERLSKEIAEALKNKKIKLIIVHGAGPFGHFLVNEYLKGNKKITPELVHDSMLVLNKIVKNVLKKQGLKTKVLHPFENCLCLGATKYNCASLFDRVKEALESGKIPIIYGDVIPTQNYKGRLNDFEVISGDVLATEFAKKWGANKVIMVSNVDKIEKEFKEDPGDVTGSMKLKLKALSKLKCPAVIVNGTKPNQLKKALLEEKVGITIKTAKDLMKNGKYKKSNKPKKKTAR